MREKMIYCALKKGIIGHNESTDLYTFSDTDRFAHILSSKSSCD
jgi:hypothetical protein